MIERFRAFAIFVSQAAGSPWAFMVAVVAVCVWALAGPAFHYSETWQLIINTGTTIATFLMMFLVQATQNRDAKALHMKLDELIRVSSGRNALINAETLSDEEADSLLENLRKEADVINTRRSRKRSKRRRQNKPHRPSRRRRNVE